MNAVRRHHGYTETTYSVAPPMMMNHNYSETATCVERMFIYTIAAMRASSTPSTTTTTSTTSSTVTVTASTVTVVAWTTTV